MAESAAMATRAAAAEEQLEYYLDRFKEATAKRLERDLSDGGISQDDHDEYEWAEEHYRNGDVPFPKWMRQRVWEDGPSILENCEWAFDRRMEDNEWHRTPAMAAATPEAEVAMEAIMASRDCAASYRAIKIMEAKHRGGA